MVVRKCQETKDITLKSSDPACKIEHYTFLKEKKYIHQENKIKWTNECMKTNFFQLFFHRQ